MNVKTEFNEQIVIGIGRRAGMAFLRRSGAYIRTTARRSVVRSKNPSAPGNPPHTRKGQLKRALQFAVDGNGMNVLIGPAESVVGLSMTAHEFGGMYMRRRYPKRPLMGPALKKSVPKLKGLWRKAVI